MDKISNIFLPLAISFLVSMISGVFTIVIYRSIRDDNPLVSVDIGTYMRLDLLLGSAKGCLGSTCISLCGWKALILSLSPLSSAFYATALREYTTSCLLSQNAEDRHMCARELHVWRTLIERIHESSKTQRHREPTSTCGKGERERDVYTFPATQG